MKIGIAVLAYNRPSHLKKVLNAIIKEKIGKISIYMDGPANQEVSNKQKIIKKIIQNFG